MAREDYDDTVKAVDEAQRAGVEVAALRVLCHGVEERLSRRRYKEASRKAEMIQRLTSQLVRDRRLASEGIAELEDLLPRIERAGVDIARGTKELRKAKSLFKGEKRVKGVPIPTYGDAAVVSKRASEEYRALSGTLVKIRRAQSLLRDEVESFEKSQDRIRGPALMERVLGEPLTTAEEAERRLEIGEYDRAWELADLALGEARIVMEEARDAMERLDALKEELSSLEAEEAPVADLQEELRRASTYLDEGEIAPAREALDSFHAHLVGVRESFRETLQQIRGAESAVAQAEAWGFRTGGQKAIVESARQALSTGRYEEAAALAAQAREEASSLRTTHKDLSEAISGLRLALPPENEGRLLPIIDMADRAMEEGDYDRAWAAVREAERRLSPREKA